MQTSLSLCLIIVCTGSSIDPKYKAWTEACSDLGASSACQTRFTGACQNSYKGLRCIPTWQKYGCRSTYLGDCGFLKEGDACVIVKPGSCRSSGRCPKFNGEMICKWNKHTKEVPMIAPGTPEGSIVSSTSQRKDLVASTSTSQRKDLVASTSTSQRKDLVASSSDVNAALTPSGAPGTTKGPIVSNASQRKDLVASSVSQRKDLVASSADVNVTLIPLGCDAAALVDPSHHDGKQLRADGDLKLSLNFHTGTSRENFEKLLADAVSAVLVRIFGSDIVDVYSIETVARRLAANKFALRFATSPAKHRHEVSTDLMTSIATDLQKQLPGIAAVTVTSMSIQWCGHSLNYNLRGKPVPASQAFPMVFIVVGVVVAVVAVATAFVCVFRKRGASTGVKANVAPSDDPTIIGGKAVADVSDAI